MDVTTDLGGEDLLELQTPLASHLLFEEVVEDAVAANDHQVALLGLETEAKRLGLESLPGLIHRDLGGRDTT